MACHEDPIWTVATVQNFFINHATPETEVVVVDNKPDSKHAGQLRRTLLEMGARYFPLPDNKGTSGPRQKVFEHARGEAVLVVDSHVFLAPGAVSKLIEFYTEHPQCSDLLTGPLLRNGRSILATHYNPGWRSEMWGMWGHAWKSPTGEIVSAVNDVGWARFIRVADGEPCLPDFEPTRYRNYEKALTAAGFTQMGLSIDDDFPIVGMGLGLFSCRRKAWVGFSQYFRGFGGAEQYIHEKFRRRGNCTRSLGFLKWWHNWTQFEKRSYPIRLEDKIANIVIGRTELGMPLDDARKHFVEDRGRLSAESWDMIAADPINVRDVPKAPVIEDLYNTISNMKGGFNEHMESLRDLAAECTSAVEFTSTKGSTVALATGLRPTKDRQTRLTSWNTDQNTTVETAARLAPWATINRTLPEKIDSIPQTDLLFIDGDRTPRQLLELLEACLASVNRIVALHGIAKDEELMPAARMFFADRKEWFVAGYRAGQGSLVYLSRAEMDRPAREIVAWEIGFGPGTELKKILATMGIVMAKGCDCYMRAIQMDKEGIEWCKENRDTIRGWLSEGAPRWKWTARIEAAMKAVQTGLAFKLDLLDPYGSLVDEAIRMAIEAEAASTSRTH
jgi:glycosyltransferase involved in cell wall biosynthesis